MNSRDLLEMSLNSLLRRKTRTILTILGVVIGTSSIIIMMSLGIGMDRSFKEDLAHMGSLNIIRVNPGYAGPEAGLPDQQQPALNDQSVADFEQIAGVIGVMPTKDAYLKIGAGKMVGSVPIMGVRPHDLEIFDFKAEEGRLLLPSDKEAIVFGSQVAYNFYNPRLRDQNQDPRMYGGEPPPKPQVDLISSKLILTTDMSYGERHTSSQDTSDKKPILFEIKGVGLLSPSNNEQDYQAFMNIAELEEILKEDERNNQVNSPRRSSQENKYTEIKVKVKDIEEVEAVQKLIKSMGYQTFSLTDMLESMKKTSRTMQAILGGIGAVSLLVAAIGIANTMVMSIYERTREIGVIKVLGADIRDIKKMFLVEAAMIGFGGGLLGLALSFGVSVLLNQVALQQMGEMGGRSISVITPVLAIGAVAFASLVGIISGYAPARRAMSLSALDAIRGE